MPPPHLPWSELYECCSPTHSTVWCWIWVTHDWEKGSSQGHRGDPVLGQGLDRGGGDHYWSLLKWCLRSSPPVDIKNICRIPPTLWHASTSKKGVAEAGANEQLWETRGSAPKALSEWSLRYLPTRTMNWTSDCTQGSLTSAPPPYRATVLVWEEGKPHT